MFETLFGGILGFSLFTLTSHPKSPVGKRIPQRKIKNIQISPEIKFEISDRFVHIHHWVLFTSLYLITNTTEKVFLHSDVVQGFMLGSIAQGLTYEDRFMLIYRSTEQKIRGKKAFQN